MKNANRLTPSLKGYLIWGLAAFFYGYEFVLRVSPGVIIENLILEFSAFELSKATLGHVSAFYFYAYALTQVPAGLMCDRFSKKYILALACLTTTLGTFLFASTHNLNIAYMSRFIIGAGSAFAFVSCLSLAKNWIPPKQFPIIVGLTNAAGMIGAILGNQPLASLVTHLGWREAFYALGYLGLILSLVLWIFIPPSPPPLATSPASGRGKFVRIGSRRSIMKIWNEALYSKQTWLLALYGCLLVAPVATFGELWGVAFFQVRFNFPREIASGLIAWIFMGIMVGGPLIGWVATQLHNYKKVMFFATTIAFSALLCVLYMPSLSLYSIRALLFIYGLCTSNMLLCFSLVSLEHSKEGQGHATAIGFTNMMIMAVGAAFQPVVGWILDINRELSNSVLPSLFEFRTALSILPLCLILALVLLFWIKTHSVKQSLQRPQSSV